MGKDDNPWKPSTAGLEFDIEGPHADYLIDTSEIYDKIVYPKVHANISEWEVINESEAEPYLPIRKTPLTVTLGVEEKKTTELYTFGSLHLPNYLKYKKGYVINTGSSIWGLDFVPKLASVDTEPLAQYLAISGYRGSTEEHIGMNEIQPTGSYKNCIQLWKLKLSVKEQEDPLLDICLLHDYGVVFNLKWCPYGTYEEESDIAELPVSGVLPKLGILSFVCGDGTVRTIIVPHPKSIRKHLAPNHDPLTPVYIKIKSSRCTFTVPGSNPTSMSWGGHKKLAVGYTFGSIVVWNMEKALSSNNETLLPDQSKRSIQMSVLPFYATVSGLSWNGIKNPERIVAAAFDGQTKVIDTNDPFIYFDVLRVRSISKAVGWASYNGPVLYSDTDGNCRGVSGTQDYNTVTLKYMDTPGICWEIGTTEHHGSFALVTSLGWLKTCNAYQIRARTINAQQTAVYKLNYSEETKSFRYTDGIKPQTLDESRQLPKYQLFGETWMALQKVAWNPNKRTSAFIATGGSAGLCRIEFVGCGTKWE